MKKRTVLSNVPVRLPIQSTILYSFLLHYFNASGLYWGIFITLYTLYWILAISVKLSEEEIDLDDDKTISFAKSKFRKRLADIVLERDTK
jgi:hypothetical protein